MTGELLDIAAICLVVVGTVTIGALGLRIARTTSDFLVASRSIAPVWNASAISGEYLSAASFLGIAGLVLVFGADMLWYAVGFVAGYLVLLLLVAAPLRRSGAYTVPDFADLRLGSRAVSRVASLLVVAIGWLYLVPQLQGAGLTLSTTTGAPGWVGPVLVGVVVTGNVALGGMRSATLVQAVQYWLKLTALAVPAVVLVAVWQRHGAPAPVGAGAWSEPLSGAGGRQHPLYATYALVVATLLGTMGLPHVLIRFYTNPDGSSARRTTLGVLGLLGLFYVLPPVFGVLGRVYAPDLASSGRIDTVVLTLPERLLPGLPGLLLGALVTAGAFAAFLSTSSGLVVSVAGVLVRDVLRRPVRELQRATLLAGGVPVLLALAAVRLPVTQVVGLAFAVAASTFCPLLVLGIWWRGLTATGALAGLLAGGTCSLAAVLAVLLGLGERGWPAVLLGEPAAWSVPLAFAVMVVVSRSTRGSLPPAVGAIMLTLHAPEARPTRSLGAAARPLGAGRSAPGAVPP